MPDSWTIDEVQLKFNGASLEIPKVREVDFKFDLGLEIQDKVTGIKGTIIGNVYYINGCKRIILQPRISDNSTDIKKPDFFSILEEDVIVLSSKNSVVVDGKGPGGPSFKSRNF